MLIDEQKEVVEIMDFSIKAHSLFARRIGRASDPLLNRFVPALSDMSIIPVDTRVGNKANPATEAAATAAAVIAAGSGTAA
jgi:hypothetical protein